MHIIQACRRVKIPFVRYGFEPHGDYYFWIAEQEAKRSNLSLPKLLAGDRHAGYPDARHRMWRTLWEQGASESGIAKVSGYAPVTVHWGIKRACGIRPRIRKPESVHALPS